MSKRMCRGRVRVKKRVRRAGVVLRQAGEAARAQMAKLAPPQGPSPLQKQEGRLRPFRGILVFFFFFFFCIRQNHPKVIRESYITCTVTWGVRLPEQVGLLAITVVTAPSLRPPCSLPHSWRIEFIRDAQMHTPIPTHLLLEQGPEHPSQVLCAHFFLRCPCCLPHSRGSRCSPSQKLSVQMIPG